MSHIGLSDHAILALPFKCIQDCCLSLYRYPVSCGEALPCFICRHDAPAARGFCKLVTFTEGAET